MEYDLNKALEEREIAKQRWESFENDEYIRFPFPRKNYKYISRIVANEENAPESVERALNYFDRHEIWVLKAEAYQHLANQLDHLDKMAIAHKVYDFVYEKLPGLSLAPELYGDGGKGFGEDRIDQAVYWLNWAAYMSQDNDLIESHTEFMLEIFPAMVRDMPDDGSDVESFIEVSQRKFDALIHPEMHCIESRISEQRLSTTENIAGYLACIACNRGLMPEDNTWEVIHDRPCIVSEKE